MFHFGTIHYGQIESCVYDYVLVRMDYICISLGKSARFRDKDLLSGKYFERN